MVFIIVHTVSSKHPNDHSVTQCMHMPRSSGQPKPDTAAKKAEKPRV